MLECTRHAINGWARQTEFGCNGAPLGDGESDVSCAIFIEVKERRDGEGKFYGRFVVLKVNGRGKKSRL